MSESIEGLRARRSEIRRSIAALTAKREQYLKKAEEIQKVYDRMKKDKGVVKEYRRNVKSYSNRTFSNFQGNNYEYVYKPKINDLISSYDAVIGRIDRNLDALNDEILRQKNLASDCLGPLGALGKALHTVQTRIENWTN